MMIKSVKVQTKRQRFINTHFTLSVRVAPLKLYEFIYFWVMFPNVNRNLVSVSRIMAGTS